MAVVSAEGRAEIDRVLQAWRQGDCVLGEELFVFRIAPHALLTQDAAAAAQEQVEIIEAQVRGFAILTQTCDLVRQCEERPFVEVCPLVEVDDAELVSIERCQRPRYAHIPSLAEYRLVADLDRVMTVEKSVVAGWERIDGCRNDLEARRLSLALARKRARMAFPDDFVVFVGRLTARLTSKHDKNSDEGRALRALREIRVQAGPSWDSARVELMFWFIRDEDQSDFEGVGWETYLEQWLHLVPPTDRFGQVDGVVLPLDGLTAREYVESDPLDLYHLSTRAGRQP